MYKSLGLSIYRLCRLFITNFPNYTVLNIHHILTTEGKTKVTKMSMIIENNEK